MAVTLLIVIVIGRAGDEKIIAIASIQQTGQGTGDEQIASVPAAHLVSAVTDEDVITTGANDVIDVVDPAENAASSMHLQVDVDSSARLVIASLADVARLDFTWRKSPAEDRNFIDQPCEMEVVVPAPMNRSLEFDKL